MTSSPSARRAPTFAALTAGALTAWAGVHACEYCCHGRPGHSCWRPHWVSPACRSSPPTGCRLCNIGHWAIGTALGLYFTPQVLVNALLGVHSPGLLALAVATGLGACLFCALRVPNPWVLGPLAIALVLAASGQQWSGLPPALSNAGQPLIGIALGSRFSPEFVRRALRWLAAVAIGTLGMIALSAGFALMLSRLARLHRATPALSTAPGGIAEMAITAAVLNLGVPVVTAFRAVRYVVVLTATGPLFRWRFGARPRSCLALRPVRPGREPAHSVMRP